MQVDDFFSRALRQSLGPPLQLTTKTKLMVEAAFCLLDRNKNGALGKDDFQGNLALAPVGVGEDTFKEADRVWRDLSNQFAVGGKPAESITSEQFITGIVKMATSRMTFSPELAGRPDEGESTIARWLQCLEEAANYHIEYLLMRVLCVATVPNDGCNKEFDELWARLCKRAGQANGDRVAALPKDEFWTQFWNHFDRFTERMSTQARKKQRTENLGGSNADNKGLSKRALMDRFKRLAYMGPVDLKDSDDSVHTVFMSMMEKDKSSVTYEKFNIRMNKQLLLWLTAANKAA